MGFFLDPRQRRRGPINSVPSVRPCVRPQRSFLGNRALLFSETLAQVRVPEMQKSDEARFLGKTPILVFFGVFLVVFGGF